MYKYMCVCVCVYIYMHTHIIYKCIFCVDIYLFCLFLSVFHTLGADYETKKSKVCLIMYV